MKFKIFAMICLLFVGLFAGTSFYFKNEQARMYENMAQTNDSSFVRPHSHTLGSPHAKVTIVEFMDPACETCAAFSPMIKQLIEANSERVKLVLRYAPFHDGADAIVKILEAAGRQGKYWETLTLMFKTQAQWAINHKPRPELLWALLPPLGLDMEKLKTDMEDPDITDLIARDLADAAALSVRKTPGFFVNGRPLEPFGREPLMKLIKDELNRNY